MALKSPPLFAVCIAGVGVSLSVLPGVARASNPARPRAVESQAASGVAVADLAPSVGPQPQATGQILEVTSTDPADGFTYVGPAYTVPTTGTTVYDEVDVAYGNNGTGTVTQTGGTLSITAGSSSNGSLLLGSYGGDTGAYRLSGGTLSAVYEFVGYGGTGVFTQTGGTNTVGSGGLFLGNSGAASLGSNAVSNGPGTYTLDSSAGTAALTAAKESIGYFGGGTFTQNGGTNTIAAGGTLTLGYQAAGVYHLNGGTLTTPSVSMVTVANGNTNAGAGTFNFNGGVLRATTATTAFLTGLTAANVQAGGATIDNNGFNVTIAQPLLNGTGGSADGGLTAQGGPGTLTLTGTNTYTGPTTFAAGILDAGSAQPFGTVGSLSFTGGTLQYSAANQTDYSGRFSTAAGQAYRIDTNGQNVTFASGLSSSAGSLVKSGAGTLTLTATETYTGGTTVARGTLAVSNDAGSAPGRLTGTGGIVLNNGSTLLLSGSASNTDRLNDAAAVTINGGGTLGTGGLNEGARPTAVGVGGAVGVGALTLASTTSSLRASIDFASTQTGSALVFSSLDAGGKGAFVSILNFTGAARTDGGAAANDRLLFVNDPGFTPTDLANWQFSNDAGVAFATGGLEIAYNGYFEIVPVPEPATWLGGAMIAALAVAVERRRRGAGCKSARA